jgi:hypothetical protein
MSAYYSFPLVLTPRDGAAVESRLHGRHVAAGPLAEGEQP